MFEKPASSIRSLLRDPSGSAMVEAAFAVPLMVILLLGILAYGSWFMTAHSLQQAANDAARASVAGLDSAERRMLVEQSVAASRAAFPLPVFRRTRGGRRGRKRPAPTEKKQKTETFGSIVARETRRVFLSIPPRVV